MERIGLYFKIKSGAEEEYKKRHDMIWPEMSEVLKRAGVRNYSIWRYHNKLFAYFETDNYTTTQEILSQSEAYLHWREYMDDIIEYDRSTKIKEYQMQLMFFQE